VTTPAAVASRVARPLPCRAWPAVVGLGCLALAASGCDGSPQRAAREGGVTGVTAGGGGSAGPARSWAPAQALEEDHAAEDNHPAVAINAAGDGVVAWQRDGELWARLYDGSLQTFGPATLVTVPSRYDDLAVGLDAEGNVMLVWARDDADDTRGIWWSRTTDHGATWSGPAAIATGNFQRSRLAVSASGGIALAAWTARSADEVIVSVGSCDFRDGAWSPVVNVPLPGNGLGDRNPRVALDGVGRGFLIWEQPAVVNQPSSVWTERYDGGWRPESVAILDTYAADDSYTPTLALDAAGGATAIWLEMWSYVPQLWARRFDGTTWADTEHLATAPLIEWDPPPMVAIDPGGTSVALWSEVTSLAEVPQYYDVHGARHVAGSAGWQPAQALETTNLIGSDLTEYAQPLVGLDGLGNAIATWRKEGPSSLIHMSSSRLEAGAAAWTPPDGAPLDDDTSTAPTHSALATDLAVSPNGTALAAWSYAPEYDIWAAVFR